MATDCTALSIDPGIARLRLTDPDKGDPIHRYFRDERCDLATALPCRDDVRAVPVTVAGRNCGFGGDIAHFGLDALARVAASEDARAGLRAFGEQRKPVFTGR